MYAIRSYYEVYTKIPVAHGDILILPDDPSMRSSVQYTYTFQGWDLNNDGIVDSIPSTIGGEMTLQAVYIATLNDVTVHFYDETGTVLLQTVTVPYGTSIVGLV